MQNTPIFQIFIIQFLEKLTYKKPTQQDSMNSRLQLTVNNIQ